VHEVAPFLSDYSDSSLLEILPMTVAEQAEEFRSSSGPAGCSAGMTFELERGYPSSTVVFFD
jgi:hypothetical protein